MNDDVIKLIRMAFAPDAYGNQVATETVSDPIFCTVQSVGRSEFYQAGQIDLHPEYVFRLSHYKDYANERELLYTDWTGTEKRYVVIRTYLVPGTDAIELTTAEKVGVDV